LRNRVTTSHLIIHIRRLNYHSQSPVTTSSHTHSLDAATYIMVKIGGRATPESQRDKVRLHLHHPTKVIDLPYTRIRGEFRSSPLRRRVLQHYPDLTSHDDLAFVPFEKIAGKRHEGMVGPKQPCAALKATKEVSDASYLPQHINPPCLNDHSLHHTIRDPFIAIYSTSFTSNARLETIHLLPTPSVVYYLFPCPISRSLRHTIRGSFSAIYSTSSASNARLETFDLLPSPNVVYYLSPCPFSHSLHNTIRDPFSAIYSTSSVSNARLETFDLLPTPNMVYYLSTCPFSPSLHYTIRDLF